MSEELLELLVRFTKKHHTTTTIENAGVANNTFDQQLQNQQQITQTIQQQGSNVDEDHQQLWDCFDSDCGGDGTEGPMTSSAQQSNMIRSLSDIGITHPFFASLLSVNINQQQQQSHLFSAITPQNISPITSNNHHPDVSIFLPSSSSTTTNNNNGCSILDMHSPPIINISSEMFQKHLFPHNSNTLTGVGDQANNSSASGSSTCTTFSNYSTSPTTNTSDGCSISTPPPTCKRTKNDVSAGGICKKRRNPIQVFTTSSSAAATPVVKRTLFPTTTNSTSTATNNFSNSSCYNSSSGNATTSSTTPTTIDHHNNVGSVQFINVDKDAIKDKYHSAESISQVKPKKKRGRPRKPDPEPPSSYEFVQENGKQKR